jgi:hypothetical protein
LYINTETASKDKMKKGGINEEEKGNTEGRGGRMR